MIIACTACATRYVVPDCAIGGGGRTVRCAKCRHSWYQEGPEGAVPAEPAAAAAPPPPAPEPAPSPSAPDPAPPPPAPPPAPPADVRPGFAERILPGDEAVPSPVRDEPPRVEPAAFEQPSFERPARDPAASLPEEPLRRPPEDQIYRAPDARV